MKSFYNPLNFISIIFNLIYMDLFSLLCFWKIWISFIILIYSKSQCFDSLIFCIVLLCISLIPSIIFIISFLFVTFVLGLVLFPSALSCIFRLFWMPSLPYRVHSQLYTSLISLISLDPMDIAVFQAYSLLILGTC